jgi:DNA-binding PadR family transcriptional regulator
MSLEYAILGFLNYRPLSGYGLKKVFDKSVFYKLSCTFTDQLQGCGPGAGA